MFTTESGPFAPPTGSDASDLHRSRVVRGTGAPVPGGVVTELRRALDQDEFRLHYQPVVDPVSGEIVGAEALLRWQHPDCGLLAPGDFLDAADRSELTVEIAEWVAATALAECVGWPANWFVSINLSPRQLSLGAARGLGATLAGLCRDHGLAPGRVWLELTEQGLLDDREVAGLLEELRSLGLHVAIDDFGSGNASLGRLRTIPFDVCKLDRSLLAELSGDAGDPAARILRLTIDLVHAFDGRVVAEGVETPEQLDLLRTLDCDLAQGFHLARPMLPEQLQNLVGVALGEPAVAAHHLSLYENDPELERIVTEFLATGLSAGSSAVLVTTGQRRDWFATALSATGIPVDELRRERRLLELDVDELLGAVLVDGAPDLTLFRTLVARILERLAPGTGPVRIYSELATTLWQQGHTDAALCLEELANHLSGASPHRVLCAYPVSAFARPGGHAGFRDLRSHHHTTAPTAAMAAAASTRGTAACGVDLQELSLVHAGH